MKKTGKSENKEVKDKIFTWTGLKKEFQRIRWPKWKSTKTDVGILENTAKIVVFTGVMIAFFLIASSIVVKILEVL